MLVIVVENAPPRLRGRLAVWLLEKGFKSQPTPFDVPQPGTGRSTLQIRFVTRTAQDMARPCQP